MKQVRIGVLVGVMQFYGKHAAFALYERSLQCRTYIAGVDCCRHDNNLQVGAYYPLQDAQLKMDYPLGVSNEFVQPHITLCCRQGTGIVILTKRD